MSRKSAPRCALWTAIALFLFAAPASAQTTYTWNGAGGDDLWSNAGNWTASAGLPPPADDVTNTLLVLTGNTQLSNTLDYSFAANSLTFDAGAGAFTIGGSNTLTLGTGGITIASNNSQTFNANIAMFAASTWANNGSGLFTVGGAIDNGGNLLTVGGTGNSALNGIITGTAGLTKTGTGTLTLGAANTYGGQTTVSAGTLAISVNDALPTANRLQLGTFTGSGATAVSLTGQTNFNLGTSSQTVSDLYTFNKNTSGTAHTITIAAGQTLTVSNAAVGTHTAFGAYDAAAASNHFLTFTGGGSLAVNTPNGFMVVGQTGGLAANQLPAGFPTATTFGSNTTVDMSGLSSFSANVSAFRVGDFSSATNNGFATLTLAPTSTITATEFVMTSGRAISGPSGTITVNLGTGVNTINANTFTIGGDPVSGGNSNPRSQGLVQFLNPTNGSLVIRGKAGGSTAANLNLGLQQNGSGGTTRNNVVNFNGHNVDILLNTVQIGGLIGGTSTSNTGPVNGTFSFDQGTVTASTLALGNRIGTTAAQNNTASTAGTVNVGGGTLTVNGSGANALRIGLNTQTSSAASTAVVYTTTGAVNVSGGALNVPNGGITLATSTGTYASGPGTFATSGTLNITGGSVFVGGDIAKGAATSPGTATSTLTLNGATAVLDLNGNRIGGTTAAQSIDVLNLQVGTLQNVLEINNGAGLTKNTAGTLTLAGTNSYTGTTSISAGTLSVATGGSTGAGSPVSVAAGGTLAGTGTVNGTVAVASGATLSPGTSGAGALTIGGNTDLSASGVLAVSAAAPGANTGITVAGSGTTFNFTTGTTLDLSLISGFGAGGTYTLVSMPGGSGANVLLNTTPTTNGQVLGSYVEGSGASGAVTIVPTGFALASGDTFILSRTGDAVILSFQPVPEPATVLGLAAGALGLGGMVRRRFRRA